MDNKIFVYTVFTLVGIVVILRLPVFIGVVLFVSGAILIEKLETRKSISDLLKTFENIHPTLSDIIYFIMSLTIYLLVIIISMKITIWWNNLLGI